MKNKYQMYLKDILVAYVTTYEYEIFNFISLYKHFNFDQYTLVMYGG